MEPRWFIVRPIVLETSRGILEGLHDYVAKGKEFQITSAQIRWGRWAEEACFSIVAETSSHVLHVKKVVRKREKKEAH